MMGFLPTIFWVRIKNQVQLEILPTFSLNYWIGQLSIFPIFWGQEISCNFFSMEGSDKIPNLKPKVPPNFLGPTGMQRGRIDEADLKTLIFWTHLRRWFSSSLMESDWNPLSEMFGWSLYPMEGRPM